MELVMPDETETQSEPVIVENNTTIIAPETEQQPTESEYSEESIRELDAWCADIERQIDELRTALLGTAPGDHSHDGYAIEGHEHSGLASEEHTHEGYAPAEHEHAPAPRRDEDKPPKETHPWFRKVGES